MLSADGEAVDFFQPENMVFPGERRALGRRAMDSPLISSGRLQRPG